MKSIAFVASLVLSAGLAGQFSARQETLTRKMTRVAWAGLSGEQRLDIEYGQPKWRPEYEKQALASDAMTYPLGNGAWTVLHSTVDVDFGDTKVPRGYFYLGLDREQDAKWFLTLTEAGAVDASGRYYRARTPDVRVPLRMQAGQANVELLEITLSVDQKQKKDVTLTLAWGPFRMQAHAVAHIDERVHPGTPEFALSAKEKTVTTASGLQYEVLARGSGASPTADDRVTVHYAGWLTDGTLFDSSYQRGEAASFAMNQVVAGFAEGLKLMQPGATHRLTIPAALAYGDRAVGNAIPAGATLVFHVTLIAVEQ